MLAYIWFVYMRALDSWFGFVHVSVGYIFAFVVLYFFAVLVAFALSG